MVSAVVKPEFSTLIGKDDSVKLWDDEAPAQIAGKGKFQLVPLKDIKPNSANPRSPESIKENAGRIRPNMLANKYDQSQPISIDGDTMETVRGDSRLASLLGLNPDQLAFVLGPDLLVPCIVYHGLTSWERVTLVNDHGKAGNRRELNGVEFFHAIKNYVFVGDMNAEQIGKHFGRSRSWAQKYMAVAKMPAACQAEFLKVFAGDKESLSKTCLRSQDILVVARDFANARKGFDKSDVWNLWKSGDHPESETGKARAAAKNNGTPTATLIDFGKVQEVANAGKSERFAGIIHESNAGDVFTTADIAFAELERQVAELSAIVNALTPKERATVDKRLAK